MIWEEVGKRIKTLRYEKEMTQEQFGELIGVSRQYVGKIEKGKKLSVEQIVTICEKTNTTMNYIVFGVADPLGEINLLDDLTKEQLDIVWDILRKVAELVKAKNGNELLIKELMRQQHILLQ